MVEHYTYTDDDTLSCRCDVELEWAENAPQEERPMLLWLFVKTASPETAEFVRFLDDLRSVVHDEIDAVYAGSLAKEGWVELYFYAPSSKRFENLTSDVMARHGGFAYERGSTRDGKWEQYFDHLYPDAYALLSIQNRHTIESLLEAGDDLAKAREVEHYLFFQTNSALERSIAFLEAHGLELKERISNEEEDYAYGAVLTKTEPVTPDAVEETTTLCFDSALSEHGHYEGWSTVLA